MGARQCACTCCVHVNVCHRQQRQQCDWQYITTKGCAKSTSPLLHVSLKSNNSMSHIQPALTHKPFVYPLLCVLPACTLHRTHKCAIPAVWPPCAVFGQGAAWAPVSHAPLPWSAHLPLASALCAANAVQSQHDCSPHWMQLQRRHGTERLMLHSMLKFLRSRC